MARLPFIDESKIPLEKDYNPWINKPLICHEVIVGSSKYVYKDGSRGRYAAVFFSEPGNISDIRKFSFSKAFVLRNLDRLAARFAAESNGGSVSGFIGERYAIERSFPFHLELVGQFVSLIPDIDEPEENQQEVGQCQ